MKRLTLVVGAVLALTTSGFANASVIGIWDLTNKTPGALGADYGLRLNQMHTLGLSGSSSHLIFDFERPGHGVRLQLVDVGGGDLELRLTGQAYGSLFDNSTADGYGSDYNGTYALDYTWRNVQANVGSFDYVADLGISMHTQGAGSGTVRGLGGSTAFQGGSLLSIFDWSGKFDHTMDVTFSKNPDATGWLTYGNGGHNGDFSFSMVRSVPEPGVLLLLATGLFGFAASRNKKNR